MSTTSLAKEEQERLDQLAKLVGSTPGAVLPFVLRDGFAETERVARAVMRAREASRTGSIVSHEQALARLDAMLTRHASSEAA